MSAKPCDFAHVLGYAQPVAPSAAGDPDAEVVAAIARYEAADRAHDAADEAMGEAYQRCRDLGDVPIPDALYHKPTDEALRIGEPHMTARDGRRWYSQGNAEMLRGRPRTRTVEREPTDAEYEARPHFRRGVDVFGECRPWPQAQARADEIVAAWDCLTAEPHARKEASGSFAAERAEEAATAEREAALAALAKVRATTPRGLRLKAALVAGWYGGIDDMDREIAADDLSCTKLALSVLRDLAYQPPSVEGDR